MAIIERRFLHWRRVDDQEISEAECLPDLNGHLLSTNSDRNSH